MARFRRRGRRGPIRRTARRRAFKGRRGAAFSRVGLFAKIPNSGNYFRTTCQFDFVPWQTFSATNVNIYKYWGLNLNGAISTALPGTYQMITNNWLYYRITRIKFTFVPLITQSLVYNTALTVPTSGIACFGFFYTCVYNDMLPQQNATSTLNGIAQFQNRPGTRIYKGNVPVSATITKPKTWLAGFDDATGTAGSGNIVVSTNRWKGVYDMIGSQYDACMWGRLYTAYEQPIDATNVLVKSAQTYNVYCEFDIEMKGRVYL